MSNFLQAVYYAATLDEISEADAVDAGIVGEVVESHEPIENFRPMDVMSGKRAGREETTPYGLVVVRKGVQRRPGAQRETMYLMRDESRDMTLVGWG